MLISIIIEWENILLAEMDRCRSMLGALRVQMLERIVSSDRQFEVLVVYDDQIVDPAMVSRELARVFSVSDERIRIRTLPAAGRHYYELKNFGAEQAQGELIAFLDSDVIPEPDWLKQLLDCFDRADVKVVAGGTYCEPTGLVGKALALTWFFPLRSSPSSAVVEASHFYANNVIFRRSVFARFPFPKLGDTDRGSCVKLALILRENGIAIHHHQGAWVSHPAPNGLRHLITRGIVHGRDELLGRRAARGRSPFWRESARQVKRFLKDLARSTGAIARHHREVGLSLAQAPVAFGIAMVYCQCRLVGGLMTQIHPRFMREHFRV